MASRLRATTLTPEAEGDYSLALGLSTGCHARFGESDQPGSIDGLDRAAGLQPGLKSAGYQQVMSDAEVLRMLGEQ